MTTKIENKYGYCYYAFEEDYIHIFSLYTHPEYRNQGKAKELLKRAIKEIRKTNSKDKIKIVANPKEIGVDKERLIIFYKSMNLEVYDYYG